MSNTPITNNITTQITTIKFDTAICDHKTTQVLHKKACQGSSSSDICINKLQEFCSTQIHTNHEFNLQTKVLECVIKCDPNNSNCKKQCEKTM